MGDAGIVGEGGGAGTGAGAMGGGAGAMGIARKGGGVRGDCPRTAGGSVLAAAGVVGI